MTLQRNGTPGLTHGVAVGVDRQAQPEGVVPPSNLAVTAPATTAAPALTQTAATSLVPGRPSGKRSVPAPTAAEAPAKKKGKKVSGLGSAQHLSGLKGVARLRLELAGDADM